MSGNEEAKQRLLVKLERECGKILMSALRDEKVIEIMLNPDGSLWVDKLEKGMSYTGYNMPLANVESILATSASILKTAINWQNPILEGEFPLDGSRLEGLFPPVVKNATFSIRKKSSSIFSLEKYVQSQIICRSEIKYQRISDRYVNLFDNKFIHPVDAIKSAILDKKNILVVGGTGSGKTTLVNAILDAMNNLCGDERVVIIEDTVELQANLKNHVQLKSTETVNMQMLLRATMRLRPDRIIVGEVRGGEVDILLKSWNSGHPGGIATIHADSAAKGLKKMVEYAMEVRNPAPYNIICHRVAEAVNFVLFIEKIPSNPGRIVSEILQVNGYKEGKFITTHIQEIAENEIFHEKKLLFS